MSYHIRIGQETEFEITNENENVQLDLKGSIIVSDDLTVNGTTTTVNTETLIVEDPVIVAGSNNTLDNTDLGLLLTRNAGNVALIWDESASEFALVNTSSDGSTAGNLTIDSYAAVQTGSIIASGMLTEIVNIDSGTLTSSTDNDYSLLVEQVLNDGTAPSGTDTYSAIRADVTTTDITGWDNVYGLNIRFDGVTVFSVDANGNIGGTNNVALQGKQTIWVPAAALRPTVTDGASALQDVELTVGQPNIQVVDFIKANDTFAQFQVALPKSWDKGTISFQVFWTVSAAVATSVTWSMEGVAIPDDGPIDVAYGVAEIVNDTATNSANDLLVTTESAPLSLAGTPTDDNICYFKIYRDVDDVGDDMVEDARLIGIKLFFTTDSGNDE